MNIIDKYFKSKTEEITFIQLKEAGNLEIKNCQIDSNMPLPVITTTLVNEITDGRLKNEMKLAHIIDGIIYLLGIDKEFKYKEAYIGILESYNERIDDYIFYKGIKYMEKQDYDSGAVHFRTLELINPGHCDGMFNHSLALEKIAESYFSKEEKKEGEEFLTHSTILLESILDVDINYSLAYYKLGFHYKYFNQFLKAKLIWEKFLPLDKDQLRIQEIREELQVIEDDVILESGLTYLSYEKFDKALEMFLTLLPRHREWWELKYFIALSYKGIGDYELAIEMFYEALEVHKSEGDLYNELGITLFTMGDIAGAVEVFSEGIENIDSDYKLYFNRGLGFLQLGDLGKAYPDIEKAGELNPHDKNIEAQRQRLKSVLDI